ncbi:MAG: LytTR family transcriptional regulator DNA-binding domain-containing protein [Blautia sp.]|nr:LytTR family transcriptional regulator DNA-binding domain-containing protein [Blautia sp.]
MKNGNQKAGKVYDIMKVTLEQIGEGKEEIIIRYRRMTAQLEGIVRYLDGQGGKILGWKDGQQCLIGVSDIIYLESVDGATFFYTEKEMYRSGHTLALSESLYAEEGFFRCSKSMILNLYRIDKLKSMPGNRIDATMDNGEHIVISRRYAKELRDRLKSGLGKGGVS